MVWATSEAESLEWLKELLLLDGVDLPVGGAVEEDVSEDSSATRQCNETPRLQEEVRGGGLLSVHITSAHLSSHSAASSADEVVEKEEALGLPEFVRLLQGRPDLPGVLESFAAASADSTAGSREQRPDAAERRRPNAYYCSISDDDVAAAVVVCGPEAMVRDVIHHCPRGLLFTARVPMVTVQQVDNITPSSAY